MANPYMPLYTGDYKRDTDHLIAEEHGAYLLLLMALWDRGGRIKNDPALLARTARISLRRWPKMWDTLKDFFVIEGDDVCHSRVTRELHKVAVISEKRREAASKLKGKKHNKNRSSTQANADQKHSIQTIGLDSSLREENPDLTRSMETSPQAASPPSPERGGGDATDGEHLAHLRRWLQGRVSGLMTAHVLSARDVRELKDGLRGGSEECLLLSPRYKPPDHVAAALESIAIDWKHLPQLKAIEGGKND